MDTTSCTNEGACPYCSSGGYTVFHSGACPRIKSIEYYQNGTIKKVEFNELH
jgi:hypothetical protein